MPLAATPILDALAAHIPPALDTARLPPQSRPAVEALLAFALGADCPSHLPDARQEWSRAQPAALDALRAALPPRPAKRPLDRDSQDADDPSAKRQKTALDDADDPPLFTLPSVSTTSPVRKKVDVTVHARSIRFLNPTSRVLESSVPLAAISRAFLLPTRGKTKGHWTVVLLSTDAADKAKSPSAQQVIFGLDALSAAQFETTSYVSGVSTDTTVAKGEETATSIRRLLSHVPVPLLEPSATVFRSACATAKSRDGAAGIDAYLSAKSGTLWFFDTGILWGESKPCEFWAVSDLLAKDGVRMISATGRTCSVILSRQLIARAEQIRSDASSGKSSEDEEAAVVETEFSMVDGREQDPITAWSRNRKHLFGKKPVKTDGSSSATVASPSRHATSGGQKDVRPNGTVKGPAWDDSDSDDDDFEASSEDLEYSSTDLEVSEDEAGGAADDNESQSEAAEESGDEPSDDEEELQEAHHPLLRPGAMPRMSKAAINMVVDMVHGDLADDASNEVDELDE